jgi:hypothetical protein
MAFLAFRTRAAMYVIWHVAVTAPDEKSGMDAGAVRMVDVDETKSTGVAQCSIAAPKIQIWFTQHHTDFPKFQ